MARILITGASGQQGGATIERLKSLRGQASEPYTLYALTRNPNSAAAKKLASEGINVVKGDLTDPSTLPGALQHIQRAFLVTDIRDGVDKETEQGKNFVKAAKEAGVEHIVFTSVEGAHRNSNVPHFNSKFAIEKELMASGIAWTILRPVAFMDNFPVKGGFARFMALGFLHGAIGNKPLQYIAVKDIGYFASEALLKPEEYKGQEIAMAGDELTIPQVCAVYGKVQYGGRWNAWKAWIPRFLTYLVPYDFRKMLQFFRERGYEADIPALRARHPGLLTFEDYLRDKSKID